MNSFVSISLISYFVGFLFLLKIRSYDKYDKEPLSKLVLLSFFGGILAVLIASILYKFIQPTSNFTDAILIVGPVEESAKLSALFFLYKVYAKDFDEIVDGIIYIAAVALGFSVVENIMYAMKSDAPYWTLSFRFIFATVGHISFSVYMGIAFYVHKKIKKNYLGLWLAFVISVLAHGLYDGFIFTKGLEVLFIFIYAFFVFLQFRLLKTAYAYSLQKKKIPEIFDNKQKIGSKNTFCCNCNNKTTTEYKIFDHRKIEVCNVCNHLIMDMKNFNRFLKYYRPKLNRKKFFNLYFLQGKVSLNDASTIIFDSKKERLNTHPADFNLWLFNENKKDLKKYHQTFEGKTFSLLGFRFIK